MKKLILLPLIVFFVMSCKKSLSRAEEVELLLSNSELVILATRKDDGHFITTEVLATRAKSSPIYTIGDRLNLVSPGIQKGKEIKRIISLYDERKMICQLPVQDDDTVSYTGATLDDFRTASRIALAKSTQ